MSHPSGLAVLSESRSGRLRYAVTDARGLLATVWSSEINIPVRANVSTAMSEAGESLDERSYK